MARVKLSDNEKKIKRNEAVAKYRERNKEKVNERQRLYRQTPEAKEKHRKFMAEYRKKNRDKSLLIQRKSWRKNADKYNERRNKLYKSDIKYRQKKIEAERRYKATGRRKELRAIHAPKLRKKSAEWKSNNKDHVKKYVRQYKDKFWIEHERQQRKDLADPYVIKVIKKETNYILKKKDIPSDLIEIKRLQLKTKRLLKNKQL